MSFFDGARPGFFFAAPRDPAGVAKTGKAAFMRHRTCRNAADFPCPSNYLYHLPLCPPGAPFITPPHRPPGKPHHAPTAAHLCARRRAPLTPSPPHTCSLAALLLVACPVTPPQVCSATPTMHPPPRTYVRADGRPLTLSCSHPLTLTLPHPLIPPSLADIPRRCTPRACSFDPS